PRCTAIAPAISAPAKTSTLPTPASVRSWRTSACWCAGSGMRRHLRLGDERTWRRNQRPAAQLPEEEGERQPAYPGERGDIEPVHRERAMLVIAARDSRRIDRVD